MIVDANVAYKCLVSEHLSDQAATVLTDRSLYAPSILDYEIASVLTRDVRRHRIAQAGSIRLWQAFQRIDIIRVDWRSQADGAFDLSLSLNATFADCLYLALAIALDDRLVTADERFVRAVASAPALRGRVVSLQSI